LALFSISQEKDMNGKIRRKSACLVLILCLTAIGASAQTFTVLLSFDGANGANPFAGLVQGLDGDLYGTTYTDGTSTQCEAACGTVFKITSGGSLTTLYSFCSLSGCLDGAGPIGTLALTAGGDFYGTTKWGGAHASGTVFKITPGGTLTTLYSFCSQDNCTDGANPTAGLVLATNGNFYGTTYDEGNSQLCGGGCGTVFKISASGNLTTLYRFSGTDGAGPAALIQATNGNLYGTTYSGGASNQGTIFRITPTGVLTSLLSFDGTDGSNPYSALVQASDGDLYGTTGAGGSEDEGTAFKSSTSGKLSTLINFCACSLGSQPLSALIQATNGNFYGTTFDSGSGGTLFQMTPSGTLTTLYTFCALSGCADGETLYTQLVQSTNGTLYGTAHDGGTNGDGTVFSLSLDLAPFVEALPSSGSVGAAVKILGSNLTGASSVRFDGTAASFKVVSASEIKTTVPSGATTGRVQVTTPEGTISSNVAFTVIP
jgi:uncharacterized repeat protein (TIGR03803 family)